MKGLKYFSFVGKLTGLFTAIDILPFGDPKTGLLIFAVASLIKVAANLLAHWMAGFPHAAPRLKWVVGRLIRAPFCV